MFGDFLFLVGLLFFLKCICHFHFGLLGLRFGSLGRSGVGSLGGSVAAA